MKVHGIMCTYLGDGEVDLGKTAAWLSNFTDSLYFYDSYAGTTPRRYVVDYDKSFPNAKTGYHSGASYFVDPAGFRQKAFAAALAAWKYDDDDWVVFIDASDGLGVDTPYEALEPLEPGGETFKFRYLYDEAEAADDYVAFPMSILLSHGTPAENTVIIDTLAESQVVSEIAAIEAILGTAPPEDVPALEARLAELQAFQAANRATYWTCEPHFLEDPDTVNARTVVRLVNVAAAKTWNATNWSKVDDYNTYVPVAEHIGIVSYAYARFSEVDYHDPSLWVEANDVGFANRLAMEAMPGRSVGLPTDYDDDDPVGETVTVHAAPGLPTCRVLAVPYCFFVSDFDFGDTTDARIFGALLRKNPRDGVWYQELNIGTTPLDPITGEPDVGRDQSGDPHDPVYWDIQMPQPRQRL